MLTDVFIWASPRWNCRFFLFRENLRALFQKLEINRSGLRLHNHRIAGGDRTQRSPEPVWADRGLVDHNQYLRALGIFEPG